MVWGNAVPTRSTPATHLHLGDAAAPGDLIGSDEEVFLLDSQRLRAEGRITEHLALCIEAVQVWGKSGEGMGEPRGGSNCYVEKRSVSEIYSALRRRDAGSMHRGDCVSLGSQKIVAPF